MSDFAWAFVLTIGLFLLFMVLQKKTKIALLNPLLLSSIFIIIFLLLTKIEYERYQKATSFITFLIAPATVSLAVPLYENLGLLKKHYKTILLTLLISVVFHALVVGSIAIILKASDVLVATMLPKSVTSAIAIDISRALGGIENLTVAIVVITGNLGVIIAPYLFKYFKIDNAIAQGLALGSVAHAVGTSKAAELGSVEASMATLSLIITGVLTVLLANPLYQLIITFL
ncbi:MAG: LrgB family protein [Acholeplasma sp.]|nr:LrgB family protein [Acholeplasma sp.]